jgi:hypothetical protein
MDSGLRCPECLGMHLGYMRSTCSSRVLALMLHLMAAPIPDVLQKMIAQDLGIAEHVSGPTLGAWGHTVIAGSCLP